MGCLASKPSSQVAKRYTVNPNREAHLKIRRRASVERFMDSTEKTSFNEDFCQAVALDTECVPWHSGPHCMNCYLGQKHTCWDPKYAKEMEGIERKVFFIKNGGGAFELSKKRSEGYAVISYRVRYPPGLPALPHHDHPFGEEYFILSGSFDDTQAAAPTGTYVKYPNGTEHAATPPPEGCEILAWWGQNNNEDEGAPLKWWGADVSPRTLQTVGTQWEDPATNAVSFWAPAGVAGAHELVLFRGKRTGETTRMLRLAGDAIELELPPGGLEMYVLEGECTLEDDGPGASSLDMRRGWWLRELAPKKGDKSQILRVKPRGGRACTLLVKRDHLLHMMKDS